MCHKKFYLLLCFMSFTFSCKEDLKTTFSENNITTKKNKFVEINIPKVVENHQTAKAINREIDKTIIAALQVGENAEIVSKSIEESITTFNNEYQAFAKTFPDFPMPWEAQIDGDVMLQTPEIISIAITSYVNTGGAHGITNITFLNFDALTGKRLKNDDLFKNKVAFETLAKIYLDANITEDDALFEPTSFSLPENIGFNEEGVLLLYNPYEMAPYATGIIDFTIPMEKVQDFLAFKSTR